MTKKKPSKPEYVSVYDVFPWLRSGLYDHKRDSPEAKEKARKKREDMQKRHPRAKSKAFGENMERVESGWIIKDPLYFIDSADLDVKQRKAYEKWLDGQTRPLIPGVEAASFSWDYDRFYDAFIEGRTATVND